MAQWRLINGRLVDVEFTGTRLISGVWVRGQSAPAPASGRIMSSLANHGGLAGKGGIVGKGGGLAG